MERIITNSHNLTVFSGVKAGETDEQALERARAYYAENVKRYEEIIAEHGNGENNYWLNCMNNEKAEAAALQIETQDEYFERVRHSYLDDPAKEITKERWWEMFEVLPPCGYKNTSRYEMFFVSEAQHYTYHSFYLWDKKTDKYYTKIGDRCDRSTWIDCAMGYAQPPQTKQTENNKIIESVRN